jgi:hypothetical protein
MDETQFLNQLFSSLAFKICINSLLGSNLTPSTSLHVHCLTFLNSNYSIHGKIGLFLHSNPSLSLHSDHRLILHCSHIRFIDRKILRTMSDNLVVKG